jgi:hypothetical protein
VRVSQGTVAKKRAPLPVAEGYFRARGYVAATPPAKQTAAAEWRTFSAGVRNDKGRYHQAAGFQTVGKTGGRYTGIMATHVVYPPGTVSLALPPNASGTQTLYAPTTKVPNGCLEVGTEYVSNGTLTTPALYVFDFCRADRTQDVQSGFTTFEIDDAFIAVYAPAGSDGVHRYTVMARTDDASPSSSSLWYAAIRNPRTDAWDPLLQSERAVPSRQDFWSIFEPWFVPGQCPKSLPPFEASAIKLFDPATKQWIDARGALPTVDFEPLDAVSEPGCFRRDDSGGASYTFTPDRSNARWSVTSTGE